MRDRALGIAVSAIVAVSFGGACAYFAIYGRQLYGLALFLGVPFAVGFLVVALMRLFGPQTRARCIGVPLFSALALSRIITPAAGGYRVCRLSTGNLIEQIEVFEPGQTLRWKTRSTPPPIRETNPFHADVDPPHLHGYYDTPRGEFTLEPLGPRLTRLTRPTWYSQKLYPQRYWNFWAELAISRIHRTVLHHVRTMSERTRLIRPSGTFSPQTGRRATAGVRPGV